MDRMVAMFCTDLNSIKFNIYLVTKSHLLSDKHSEGA